MREDGEVKPGCEGQIGPFLGTTSKLITGVDSHHLCGASDDQVHLLGLAAELVVAGRHNGNKRQKIHTQDEEKSSSLSKIAVEVMK